MPRVIIRFLRAAAFGLMSVLPLPALAQGDAPRYVFIFSSGEMPAAGAGLHLAITAGRTGREVYILLMADGLDLARKGASGPVFAAYGIDGPGMLARAVAAGATVGVCQICLGNQGIDMTAMVEGTVRLTAQEVLDLLERADVVFPVGSAGAGGQIMTSTVPAPKLPPAAPEPEVCDPATDIDGCM